MQTELIKVKTCLINRSDEDDLNFVSLYRVKWLQSAIDKLEKSKPDLVKLV